jgi:integrase
MNAVKKSPNKVLPFIIGMLLLTGARRGEVLHAKWEDFDTKTMTWRIPISKSGKARHVPISTGVINILDTIPRIQDCPYVFANPKTKEPFVQPFQAWDTARKKLVYLKYACTIYVIALLVS